MLGLLPPSGGDRPGADWGMYFDGIALRACLCHVRRKAIGARIQRIVQPSALSLAFSLYTAKSPLWLVCSAEAPAACLYLAGSPPGPSIDAPGLCPLLSRNLGRPTPA